MSLELLFVVGICLVLWSFKLWHKSVPKTLQDIFDKHCITVPIGDLNTQYLAFLMQYSNALRNPRRYLLSAVLVCSIVIYILFSYLPIIISSLQLTSDPQVVNEVVWIILTLFIAIMVEIGFMYCLGIILWSLLISGRYVSKLTHTFELNIQPVHSDGCGGLHEMGNFCFTAASPLLIGSAFFLGWMGVFIYLGSSGEFDILSVGIIIFVILLVVFPVGFFVSLRPLWHIHSHMLRKREKDEEHFFNEIATLREKILELLDANQIVEAKNMKDKKEMEEALYIPYPTWPFNFRAKIFTTILKAGGSLLLGILTALVPPLIQAIIEK